MLAPDLPPEGERKQITVLFVDMVGSTELAVGLDPELWSQVIETYFEILCDGVRRFEGTVEKFTGDGIMALFGAPIAQEDHARRACQAALELQQRVARYSAQLSAGHGFGIAVRMGINSGEVVVKTIGGEESLEYTAVGHAVNLAQRMEALARPGATYVTGHTAVLAQGYFDVSSLGRFEVKGLPEPVEVFELLGPGVLQTPLQVAEARGFSRFVGRTTEIAAIESAMEEAIAGEARVVGLVGAPGVGKSRLCHEIAQRCRGRGFDIWVGHGLAHAQSAPFIPLLEIIRAFFGVTEQDDDALVRTKITQRLAGLDEGLVDIVPLLVDFLGVADPQQPPVRIDPEARQRQLFAALNRMTRCQGAQNPGVIIVEDLHWLDPASETFLENQIAGLGDSRVLLLVSFRPEYRARWMESPAYIELALESLAPEAAERLLRDILGADPSLEPVAATIRDRTGGNPFYIEEVVSSLAETGALEGSKGAYRATRAMSEVTIPPTVHAVLAARIDRCRASDKAVLEVASVIGRVFAEPVLAHVTGVCAADLAASLRALTAADLVREEATGEERSYAFRHPLIEEVAYRSQLSSRRERAHRLVGTAIEELYPDRLDELSALLAGHWESAGDQVRAVPWRARAATWAGYTDPFEAARHWRRIRELTAQADDPELEAMGVMARIMMLNFGWRLGVVDGQGVQQFEDDMARVFEEGRTLSDRLQQAPFHAMLLATYAGVQTVTGHLGETVELGRQADELARGAGDAAMRIAMRPALAYALFVLGRLPEARAAIDEALALAGDDRSLGAGIAMTCPYAWLVLFRGVVRGWGGEVAEGLADLERAGEIARQAGDLENEAWSHINAGALADLAGDAERARVLAQRGVAIAEEVGGAFQLGYAYQFLGGAHVLAGEWEPAIAALDRAIGIRRRRHVGLEAEPYALTLRARAQLGARDVEGAVATADEAIRFAGELRTRVWELLARRERARALLATGKADVQAEVAAELGRALALVEETGALACMAWLHGDVAELANRYGTTLDPCLRSKTSKTPSAT